MQQNKLSFWITMITCILVGLCLAPSAFAQVGSISGRITNANGAPISGLWVQTWTDSCYGHVLMGIGANTDSNGYYTISNVPEGSVYIQTDAINPGVSFNLLEYADKWWDGNNGSTDCQQGVAVNIVADQNVGGINMALELGGSISGRVSDTDGNPILGVWVQTWTDSCNGEVLMGLGANTDASGEFTIHSMPVGPVYIQTSANNRGVSFNLWDYVDKWWDAENGTTDCNEAVPATVTAGADTSGIDFSLALYTTQSIDSGGGTVSLPDDSAWVFFPPDSIPDEVFVSIVEVEEASVPSPGGGFELLGSVYDFSAEDADGNPVTSFGEMLTITLRYDPANLGGLDEQSLMIWYYDETGMSPASWRPLPTSVVNTVNHTVTVETNHFSLYGLLGVPIPEPTTWVLFGIGLFGLFALARRKRRQEK